MSTRTYVHLDICPYLDKGPRNKGYPDTRWCTGKKNYRQQIWPRSDQVNKDRSQCQCQYHLNADLATKDCKVLEGFIPEAPPKALNTFDKALTKA